MPRRGRIILAGYPHHVIQRGNRRQNVFIYEEDKRSYLTEGNADEIKDIRVQIKLGLPWGCEDFLRMIELKYGQVVRKLKVGRKPKK